MDERIDFLLANGYSQFGNAEDLYIKGKHVVKLHKGQSFIGMLAQEFRDHPAFDMYMQQDRERNSPHVKAEEPQPLPSPPPEVFIEPDEPLVFEDMEIESEQSMYEADEVKAHPTPIMRRLSYNGLRYYFRKDEAGEIRIYESGTNFIKLGYARQDTMLEEWRLKMHLQQKNPDEIARLRADFGTIMHVLFARLLMGDTIKLRPSAIAEMARNHVKMQPERLNLILGNVDNLNELIEDVVSFKIFCQKHNVKPLLIEKILCDDRLGVATAVDLVCEMDYEYKGFYGEIYKSGENKGQPKETKETRRIVALIDFKSNQSGVFYPEYALQVALGRRLVNLNYKGVLKVNEIFNFSPKPYAESSQFHLKRQTENPEIRKELAVYAQAMRNSEKKVKTYKGYTGSISLDRSFEHGKQFVCEPIYKILSQIT